MKCKRLCAWLLSLVMMFSLLPVSAAAAGIPAEYAPIFKWAGGPSKRKINVELFFENESSPLGTTSSEGEGTICNINVPNGKEIYKSDASSGCSFAANKFTFWEVWDKSGDLKLYTRSTAGHTVTVNYVFDDASGNTKDSVTESVKYNDTETFDLVQDHYDYTIKRESGDATHKVDTFNRLSVTGGAENSVFTVTYTPKKNMAYLDQYYKKEGVIDYPKWNEEHLSFNGPDVLDNNRYEKAYLIQGGHLTELLESARFLDVDGTIYDFTAAKQLPSDLKVVLIDKVWYDREDAKWYYTSTAAPNIPVPFTSIVNLYYGEKHDTDSEYHDFVATTTVEPTCTKEGYTDYKCRYCGKEGQRKYVLSLGGHVWKYVHDNTTSGADSKHYQVCKRCNEKGITEKCEFKSKSIGTETEYTCTKCDSKYTESAPQTETVYVYFQTVHPKDGNVRVNEGVTYNNPSANWATLGKLTTEQTVAASTNKTEVGKLGKEVNKTNSKFVKHQDNENFDLDLINEWVELKKEPNGAAGYVGEAPYGKDAWHLNGKVNVYKLSYNANPPDGVGVEAVTGMPDSAYYLPGRNATVSTDDPTLQGYDFGGWYKEREFVTEAKGTVAVTEDTVLYAKWTPAQPTTDFGAVVITTTKPELKEDLSGGAYEVPYTATYTMSDNLLRMLQRAPHGVPMTFVVKLDSRLTAKTDGDGKFLYDFDGAGILEVDESKITVSPGGHTITVVCKPTADWKKALEGKTSVVMKLDGTGVLAATDFAVGEYLSTKGHIEGTIGSLPIMIPANVCRTKMTAQTYTVTYDGNDADSGETTDTNAYTRGTVATVKANGFTRSKYTFTGWNMKADGSGKSYAEGAPIKMLGNVVLYAQWSKNSSHDDDDDKYFFAIQKVDAQDDHALNGAKFELYQRDRRDNKLPASRKTTASWGTESGIALFSVSATKTNEGGDTWYYREITAPEGYVLDSTEHKIKATNFSDSRSTAVQNAVAVRNYRGTTPDLLNDSDHFAYVIGYMDGNVRPYGLISRAETTTIFFRLLKDSVRDGNLLTSNTYTDVADDYWANTAISTMTGLGIVQGRSTTTFDPKAPITRAQFAAICARFDTGKSSDEQTFTDIKGHWAEKYIERAAELGWIKGFEDGTFRPDTYITRAQAMTMINRVLNRIPEDESDLLPGMNVWPDCNPGDWFYLAVQEATNSHDFEHKAGNYETWTKLMKNPDWTRYEN